MATPPGLLLQSHLALAIRRVILKGVRIADPQAVRLAFATGVRHVINFTAERHVDRGTHDSGLFVRTNRVSVQVLLAAARS
jgi:dTDP-D-glucose 4,6-dehydratase